MKRHFCGFLDIVDIFRILENNVNYQYTVFKHFVVMRNTPAAKVPAASDQPARMSSSEKVLGVISVFSEARPEWTVDEIAAALGLARTTAYRYARTLTETGFLAPSHSGSYILGARIIELDRQIRLGDPLMRAGPAIMATVRERIAGFQMLCSYYGERVICIYDDVVDRDINSSYERGRPFPLFRGGPSRVILAHLPTARLRHLMLHHPQEIATAGLGRTWPEFSKELRRIRQAGYFAAQGEIHPHNFGISAPILHSRGVAGCLCVARPMAKLKKKDIDPLIELTVLTAGRISARIQAQ